MSLPDIDELRPLTAGRLLEIRREVADTGCDELERAARCNAQVLAESCLLGGETVFPSGEAVLKRLTFREIEGLLGALSGGIAPAAPAAQNPQFDPGRFTALQTGKDG